MSGALRIGDIEVHPAANLFPEMGDDDLDALYESVKEHGICVPLVFFDGKLIDGRNRLRASVMAGMDTAKLPRRSLDAWSDPYQWAWDANCARLDYTPAQKAAIRIKVEEASGELAAKRMEAFRKANAARAEKAKGNGNAAKERPENGRPSPEGPPPAHRDSPVAQSIAERANVSRATVERVQKMKREDPEAFEALAAGKKPERPEHREPPKNWSVPRDIALLSVFLRERLTSHDRLKLARLLAE